MRRSRLLLLAALLVVALSGCYHRNESVNLPLVDSLAASRQRDSTDFERTHHYGRNYNFIVRADSIVLLRQQPEELFSGLMTDSVVVHRHDHLVVADMRTLPSDPVDSVWVQVARDQSTMGWVHEKTLLPRVVPDDPISQFIATFSDSHLIIFLVVVMVIGVGYLMRVLLRKGAHIVHFRDIDSFYPTLLTLIVSAAATFYASLQMFAPDVWQEFYFHPTLNPFSEPVLLGIFLASVWAMLIVSLAACDDAYHQLPLAEAALYLCGLAGVCAVDYVVFSVFTLYYVGYLLLVLYVIFAMRQYFRHSRAYFVCGNCGAKLHHKGRCPHCGAINS